MFNNIFCKMKVKKIIHWGGGLGEWARTVLISSWKCNFSIYLDIKVYYLNIQAITRLLCLLLVLYVLVPFIHSFFYLTTALLKSEIFQHSNILQKLYNFSVKCIIKKNYFSSYGPLNPKGFEVSIYVPKFANSNK